MATQLPPPVDGNQNRTGEVLAMVIAAQVITSLVVGLRMFTRTFLAKCVGWDDWTIIAAWIGNTIGAALDFRQTHYGFGRHRYFLMDDQYQQVAKLGYVNWIQTFFTLMISKVSICLLLLRIIVEKKFVRPVQGMIVFLVLSNLVITFIWIFQCTPVAGAWDPTVKERGKCLSKGEFERLIISQALISVIADFALAGFPIIMLWRVHIKLQMKVLLCSLMGLGILTAACCLVRTVFNWQVASQDDTWIGVYTFMWRSAETNIGIITACIPTLIPLYRLLTGQRKDSKDGVTGRTGDSNSWFLRLFKSIQSSASRSSSNRSRSSKTKSTDKQGFAVHVEDQNSHPSSTEDIGTQLQALQELHTIRPPPRTANTGKDESISTDSWNYDTEGEPRV